MATESTSKATSSETPQSHRFLFFITVFMSIIIMLIVNIGLIFSVSFLNISSLTSVYIFISIVSLIIGFISGLILNKIVISNKWLIGGAALISFVTSILIGIILTIIGKISENLSSFSGGELNPIGTIANIFATNLNPINTSILIFLFFNIIPMIIFFRQPEKNTTDLLIYLYAAIAWIILYFGFVLFASYYIYHTFL